MARVRDEMNLPAAKGICPICSSGQEETVEHLLARMASKATQRFLKKRGDADAKLQEGPTRSWIEHVLVDAGDAPTEKVRPAEARDFVRQAVREGGVYTAKRRQGLRASIARVDQGRSGARRILT